jgi:hypothetical protein
LFEKNIWLWCETNRYIRAFLDTINSDRYLLVRSESLFALEQKIVDRLFDFLGLTKSRNQKIAKVAGLKWNRQMEGQFVAPDGWDSMMEETLMEIAGKEIVTLNSRLTKVNEQILQVKN